MAINNFVIRLMTVDDLDAVASVEQKSYASPWTLRQFLQELENPIASILVCEADAEIVGFICFWLISGEMQILNLATVPQFRRSGIAACLLEHTFNYGLSEGLLFSVWLEVRRSNRAAIILYQRYGFKQEGIRKAYYRDGEDAFIMVKYISNS